MPDENHSGCEREGAGEGDVERGSETPVAEKRRRDVGQ